MSRAVITRTRPFGNLRKTTNAKRPLEGFTQGDVELLTGSPNLVIARKDLLHLFGRELMPGNVENVVVVPVKPGNDHLASA
jgi:hypothetical protein